LCVEEALSPEEHLENGASPPGSEFRAEVVNFPNPEAVTVKLFVKGDLTKGCVL
jgi:hypothetical protein